MTSVTAAGTTPATAMGTAPAAARSTLVPADVRLVNLARIVRELRTAGGSSRSDLARSVGISVPTVHRLISDLAALDLVEEAAAAPDGPKLGRPPVVYRFREQAALLAGADVGNETTRLAITTLAGRVLAAQSLTSDRLGHQLAGTLAGKFGELLGSCGYPASRLAGVAVGIAAAVDADGVLRDPPTHKEWDGLPLRSRLAELLGADVAVAQDDHLSPIAESSGGGTFPGMSSLLVVEIGRGIGVGMTLDGMPIAGAHHRFGRIAGWPVSVAGEPDPAAGGGEPARGTLGECLVTSGLVRRYHARRGGRDVRDGADLAAVARDGDKHALGVFRWAGREIADLVTRLHQLCDPQAVVIGGGLARAYDLLEPGLSARLPPGLRVARSVLGEHAVVTGAVLVAGSFVDSWLNEQLARV